MTKVITILIPLCITLSLFVGCHSARELDEAYAAGYAAAAADAFPMPDPSLPDLGFAIDWIDVDSTMFTAIGYDSARSVLGVRFRDSGKRYYYAGFSPEEYEAFASASSLGQYYNEHITGNYYSFREDGSSTGASPY